MVAPAVFFSGFKVNFKLLDCFMRCTNPKLAAKCKQILCVTSCEFDERAAKPKFVAQGRPALLFATQNNSQVERFCVEHIVAAFKTAICKIRVFDSRISPLLEHSTTYLSFFL